MLLFLPFKTCHTPGTISFISVLFFACLWILSELFLCLLNGILILSLASYKSCLFSLF